MADHYTKVPNWMMEKMMRSELSPSEFRVLLLIIRQTIGFQRDTDKISIAFIRDGTGLSESSVVRAIGKLKKKKWIRVKKRKRFGVFYEANEIKLEGGSVKTDRGVLSELTENPLSELTDKKKIKDRPASDMALIGQSSLEKKIDVTSLETELGDEYE